MSNVDSHEIQAKKETNGNPKRRWRCQMLSKFGVEKRVTKVKTGPWPSFLAFLFDDFCDETEWFELIKGQRLFFYYKISRLNGLEVV